MKLAIGSDHGGYHLKQDLKEFLADLGFEYQDLGTDSTESVDYPEFAQKVTQSVAEGEFERGILICGTGIGMSIAANKVAGIRAALCHDIYSARMAKLHNNANILTLGARVIGVDLAREIVKTWLEEEFAAGRHQRRINKMSNLGE